MAFYNNDIYGNKEFYGVVNILKTFGQITVKQAADIFNISESDARAVLHRAWHENLVQETIKDKYILNCCNNIAYDEKMEYALNLAILMCKNNEGLDFNEFLKDEEEPMLIWLPMGEDEYDIIYIEQGKEKIISNRLRRLNLDTNYLVILEHEGQIEYLNIDNVSAIYLIKDGELVYVQ